MTAMPPSCQDASQPQLLTVGHGTAGEACFGELLRQAGVQLVVDVRSAPGSRRHPQFRRAELERWLPAAGIGYRWEPRLGGFRRPAPDSPNVSLRHLAFRGYADHMATGAFSDALAGVLGDAAHATAAIMCAESLWWRCHRRLIADAAVLIHHAGVWHLGHDGGLAGHRLTEGARLAGTGVLVYDGGQQAMA